MLVKLDNAPSSFHQIVLYLCGRPVNKSIWSVLQRLVFGALVYFIWQERNSRCFQNKSRSFDELCGIVRDTVRCKMMSLKVRPSRQSYEAASLWNLHVQKRNKLSKFIPPNE